ncbi:MAG TPA: cell division protein FtsL [Acidimicrobiales bacterium]|nr:cell division protein FtsL [Acidimicrobiales bacterium]
MLLALCVFGVVVAHVAIAQGQFQLEQLRESSAQKQAEYDRLRLQVAELESPERIVADAQQRLGMVTPPGVTYLAPSADEPPAPANAAAADQRSADAAAANTGWSTVKPHLADG